MSVPVQYGTKRAQFSQILHFGGASNGVASFYILFFN